MSNVSLQNPTTMSITQLTIFNQVAEIQVSYHNEVPPYQRPQVTCSDDAYRYFRRHWEDDQLDYCEKFKVMLLNRANKVLGIITTSSGGQAGTVADPKMIFGPALKASAASIVLGHNHPSGNLIPSEADMRLTLKLKEAGQALDLPVLDHLIVTRHGHYSFADEKIL